MNEFDGFMFWKRFDSLRPQGDLKEFVREHGLDYVRVTNQRSDCRMPKINDLYAIAQSLNVSIEYLLTGKDTKLQAYPPRIQAVVDILLEDDTKLNAVCTLLQIPAEKDQPSSYSAKQASS